MHVCIHTNEQIIKMKQPFEINTSIDVISLRIYHIQELNDVS